MIEKVITLPESPREGHVIQDGVTGKFMFYRFGKWREIDEETAKKIESNA